MTNFIKDMGDATCIEHAAVVVNEIECNSNKVAGTIHFFSKEVKVASDTIGESQPIDEGFRAGATRLISDLKQFVNEGKKEPIESNVCRRRMALHQQS